MIKIIYHRNNRFSFLYKSGDIVILNGKSAWETWQEFFEDYTYCKSPTKIPYYQFNDAYERDKRKKEVQLQLEY